MPGLIFLGWAAIAFTAALFVNVVIEGLTVHFECAVCAKRFKIRTAAAAWRFSRQGCLDCNASLKPEAKR